MSHEPINIEFVKSIFDETLSSQMSLDDPKLHVSNDNELSDLLRVAHDQFDAVLSTLEDIQTCAEFVNKFAHLPFPDVAIMFDPWELWESCPAKYQVCIDFILNYQAPRACTPQYYVNMIKHHWGVIASHDTMTIALKQLCNMSHATVNYEKDPVCGAIDETFTIETTIELIPN